MSTAPTGWKGTGHRPATPAQIAKIHVLKNVLDIDDAAYRELVARHGAGVTSSRDMSRSEAHALIDELERKAGRPERVTSGGNVVALATVPQKALILHLIGEIHWLAGSGGYFCWLKSRMGMDAVRTKEDASRVINGLRGLKRHGHTREV